MTVIHPLAAGDTPTDANPNDTPGSANDTPTNTTPSSSANDCGHSTSNDSANATRSLRAPGVLDPRRVPRLATTVPTQRGAFAFKRDYARLQTA